MAQQVALCENEDMGASTTEFDLDSFLSALKGKNCHKKSAKEEAVYSVSKLDYNLQKVAAASASTVPDFFMLLGAFDRDKLTRTPVTKPKSTARRRKKVITPANWTTEAPAALPTPGFSMKSFPITLSTTPTAKGFVPNLKVEVPTGSFAPSDSVCTQAAVANAGGSGTVINPPKISDLKINCSTVASITYTATVNPQDPSDAIPPTIPNRELQEFMEQYAKNINDFIAAWISKSHRF